VLYPSLESLRQETKAHEKKERKGFWKSKRKERRRAENIKETGYISWNQTSRIKLSK
jgi:hypothetical protein